MFQFRDSERNCTLAGVLYKYLSMGEGEEKSHNLVKEYALRE